MGASLSRSSPYWPQWQPIFLPRQQRSTSTTSAATTSPFTSSHADAATAAIAPPPALLHADTAKYQPIYTSIISSNDLKAFDAPI